MGSIVRERWRGLGPLRWALLIVFLLGLPTLYVTAFRGLGFVADDFWHILAFRGETYPGGPVADDLFRFSVGDPAVARAGMLDGSYSWYVDPKQKIAFFRPLTGLLHAFDYVVFGANALEARIHSLAWYVALVVVVHRLFVRLLPQRIATLALFVFACVAAHWEAIAWTAARNALVSATFACGALLYYVRFRSERRPWWLALSALLFALGIAAGESAFGLLPYLLGYELVSGSGRLRERALSLLPFALLSLGAVALYAALGYGVQHSSAYLSPLIEPLDFLAELPLRLACMLSFGYAGFPADIWFIMPQLRFVAAGFGALTIVLGTLSFALVQKHLERGEFEAGSWMGLAALGAMVPQAGGLLGARSMTMPSLGTSVVVAVLLTGTVTHFKAAGRPFLARAFTAVFATAIVIVHFVLAPASWLTNPYFYQRATQRISAAADSVELDRAKDQTAMLLQVSEALIVRYLPFELRTQGRAAPRAWHSLSQASHDHAIHRTGPESFELEVIGGEMLETPIEAIDRPRGSLLRAGDHVELGDYTVRVVDAGPIGPRRLAVRCKTPLEDPSWLFLIWKDGQLERFRFPPIGQSVRIPFSPPPTAL